MGDLGIRARNPRGTLRVRVQVPGSALEIRAPRTVGKIGAQVPGVLLWKSAPSSRRVPWEGPRGFALEIRAQLSPIALGRSQGFCIRDPRPALADCSEGALKVEGAAPPLPSPYFVRTAPASNALFARRCS